MQFLTILTDALLFCIYLISYVLVVLDLVEILKYLILAICLSPELRKQDWIASNAFIFHSCLKRASLELEETQGTPSISQFLVRKSCNTTKRETTLVRPKILLFMVKALYFQSSGQTNKCQIEVLFKWSDQSCTPSPSPELYLSALAFLIVFECLVRLIFIFGRQNVTDHSIAIVDHYLD